MNRFGGTVRDPDRPVAKLDRQSPARPLADARCGWKNHANSSRPRRPEVWCTVGQGMFTDQPALSDKEGGPCYTESVYHRYPRFCLIHFRLQGRNRGMAENDRLQRVLRYLLAGILLPVLLLKGFPLAGGLFQSTYVNSVSAISGAAFVILLVLAIGGLLFLARVGFYALYVLAPFSTIMLGISLVPFVVSWLPWSVRTPAVIGLNISVVVLCGIAHRLYNKAARSEALRGSV
jgi:hypothetical protein